MASGREMPTGDGRRDLRGRGTMLAFAVLCVAWSTTFVSIKIGLDQGLPPLTFAALRTALAAIGLRLWICRTGERPPSGRSEWAAIAPAATLGVSVTFALLFWAQQHTTSGVSGLVVGTQPLVTAILARRFANERVQMAQACGLALGLVGLLVVLADRTAAPSGVGIVAGVAIFVASTAYAASAVYVQVRLPGMPLVRLAYGEMAIGAVSLMAVSFFIDGMPTAAAAGSFEALAALGYLSVNTCVAFVLYLWLLERRGATGASLYAFVTPVGTLLVGSMLYGEPVGWGVLVGALLILGGLALGRKAPRRPRLAAAEARPADGPETYGVLDNRTLG